MHRIRLILVAVLVLSFFVAGSLPAGAAVITGSISDLSELTTFTFGDGTNDLNIQWDYLPSGAGAVLSFDYYNYPDASDAEVDVLSGDIAIDSFDAEPGDWHDMFETFAGSDIWVAFKGLNGYYGLWHIDNYSKDQFGRTFLNGQWYFQDDGTSYFGTSNVPVPAAVWLLGSGFIGLVGLRKKFKK